MKKYRCPKCGETYQGEQSVCPKCKTPMHYRKKQEIKVEEEAKTIERFNFEDPDVIKHDEKVPETPIVNDDGTLSLPENKQVKKDEPLLITGESFFNGRLIQHIGWSLLAFLLTIITAFIALPWAACMLYRWEINHTFIQGHKLKFTGKGSQLLGRWLLWMLLTILTATIFALWIPIFLKKWKVSHTVFVD